MKTYLNPDPKTQSELCKRPELARENIDALVDEILKKVKAEGDQALTYYSEKWEGCALDSFEVTKAEFEAAQLEVDDNLKRAIQFAQGTIEKFHQAQIISEEKVETARGVSCWRKSLPIEKVGLYIPGGTAPLFSTILMLGVPAKLAGCSEIVLCTPPRKDGSIDPAILFTANLIGITQVFKVGGAQAIAAMAYGTESIPAVYKIFGPGNQYVTKAKQKVQEWGVAIDMPAGPSEVLVIADGTCVPEFVAADLLSQAEHGVDSQVVLVTTRETVVEKIQAEIELQLAELPRKDLAAKALEHSFSVVLPDMKACFDFSNRYAPEHLIVASEQATNYIDFITNAGSVFLGKYSCESAGDYASGTNHTLPTNGYAKSYSGVSMDSFFKKITFQNINEKGILNIGPAIEVMAAAEGLQAHKNAVSLRLKSLSL